MGPCFNPIEMTIYIWQSQFTKICLNHQTFVDVLRNWNYFMHRGSVAEKAKPLLWDTPRKNLIWNAMATLARFSGKSTKNHETRTLNQSTWGSSQLHLLPSAEIDHGKFGLRWLYGGVLNWGYPQIIHFKPSNHGAIPMASEIRNHGGYSKICMSSLKNGEYDAYPPDESLDVNYALVWIVY